MSTANATANPKSLADVYNEGGYHPLSRDSIVAALEAVEATPDDFPTELQKQQGQYCGCSYWWKDPCRTEFRKVRRAGLRSAALPFSALRAPTATRPVFPCSWTLGRRAIIPPFSVSPFSS